MIPFVVLVVSFTLFRFVGLAGIAWLEGWQPARRAGLAVMFLLTASAHWGRARTDLVRMVPPRFPRPEFLVTLTGALEILGAAGLLIPATAQAASFGLAALLIAMFPANVHAARVGLTLRGKPATKLPLRTALQVAFLAAVVAAGWK